MNKLDSDEPPALKPVEPIILGDQQTSFLPAEINLAPKSLVWIGASKGKALYQAKDSLDDSTQVSVMTLMSEDEKIIFRAFQDWYSQALRHLADKVRGYYSFEVLQFFVGDAPKGWSGFVTLLVNHASKMKVLEKRLIQFGSLWGVLEQRTEADFGKVESKLQVDFYKPQADFLVRKIKKYIDNNKQDENHIFVFKDESTNFLLEDSQQFELFKEKMCLKNEDGDLEKVFLWHSRSKRCLRI